MAARRKVLTNPVLGELIDWYKVLRDLPAFAHLAQKEPELLAVI